MQIYEDKGIVGAKTDEDGLTLEREGIQEILANIETLEVEYVIVHTTEITLKPSRGRRKKSEKGG